MFVTALLASRAESTVGVDNSRPPPFATTNPPDSRRKSARNKSAYQHQRQVFQESTKRNILSAMAATASSALTTPPPQRDAPIITSLSVSFSLHHHEQHNDLPKDERRRNNLLDTTGAPHQQQPQQRHLLLGSTEDCGVFSPCRHYDAALDRDVGNTAASSATTVTATSSAAVTTDDTPDDNDPLFDMNNTVAVSLSLALPSVYNLTHGSSREVEILLDGVSTAATDLFRASLDETITMIDEAPTNISASVPTLATDQRDDSTGEDTIDVTGSQEAPPVNNDNDVETNGESDTYQWGIGGTNDTTATPPDPSLIVMDQAMINEMMALVAGSALTAGETESDEATQLLWAWLDETTLTKDDLYHMVLEYLDVAEEPDPKGSSSLLSDLKAEIRRSIYDFFFGDDLVVEEIARESPNSVGKGVDNIDIDDDPQGKGGMNDTTTDAHGNTTANIITHVPTQAPTTDQAEAALEATTAKDTTPSSSSVVNSYVSSGLWEMYLADTLIDYVPQVLNETGDPDATYQAGLAHYAWWETTMIYPVYIRYEVVYVLDGTDKTENSTLVGTVASTNSSSTTTVVEAYYVPVTDQGTLDFIGRLLQRVLDGVVVSGVFMDSLEQMALEQQQQGIGDPLLNEIMGLAMPGSEYVFDEVEGLVDVAMHDGDVPPSGSEPYAEADMHDDQAGPERESTDEEAGTYNHSLLDEDEDYNQREYRLYVGLGLLIVTFGGVGAFVALAILRSAAARKAQEEAWLLGTDQDVGELLRVGWLQYHIPATKDLTLGPHQFVVKRPEEGTIDPTNDDDHHSIGGDDEMPFDSSKVAEIIQVYDKSGAGYYDNDSMLHGSTMEGQTSVVYDSDAEKIQEPANGGGFKHRPVDPLLESKLSAAEV